MAVHEQNEYRGLLLDGIIILHRVVHELYYFGTELGFCNDLKDLNEIFLPNEEMPFEINLLLTSDDAIVKRIGELIVKVDQTITSIVNLNAINNEEFDFNKLNEEYIANTTEYVPRTYTQLLSDFQGYMDADSIELFLVATLLEGNESPEEEKFEEYGELLMDMESSSDTNVSMLAICIHEITQAQTDVDTLKHDTEPEGEK